VIALARRYHFPAAHVLASGALSPAENDRIFGKCANPNGHGHDYGVTLVVSGRVHPETGQIAPPEELDAAFDRAVRNRLSHRMLNELPQFRDLVPTAEVIAHVIFDLIAPEVARLGADLARVEVEETPRNFFVYGAPPP
jgi:6-pyruvoyltetrahydropterin/6-carboxytetrahydropterin synthase